MTVQIKFDCQKQQGACRAAAIWHNKKYRKRRTLNQQAANAELDPLTLSKKKATRKQENVLGNAADS